MLEITSETIQTTLFIVLKTVFQYVLITKKLILNYCTELYNNNKLMVGYGKHKENEFVRLVSINRENSKEDILNFFKVLEEFENNL